MDFPKLKLIRTDKAYEIDQDDDVKGKKTNKDTEYPMVYVRAVDWRLYSQSYTMPYKFSPVESSIVGFLIEDEKDYVSIGFEKFYEDDGKIAFRQIDCIPRANVQAMMYLDVIPRKVKK